MSVQSELAQQHQARIINRTDLAAQRAVNLWRGIDPNALDAGWSAISPRISTLAAAVVVANAKDSQTYLNAVAGDDGADPGDSIVFDSFTGVDATGRSMDGLLQGAVTTTKEGMTAGLGLAQSFLSGASFLATMFNTAVHDIGRSSDLVASTGRGYTHYVRVVNPGACSRCAMLAGIASGAQAFQRHPNCHCTSAPVKTDSRGKVHGEIPEGLYASPTEYFDSLPKAEQDRIFTNAGAEAIRSGADLQSVVGARRGAQGIRYSSRYGAQRLDRGSLLQTRIGTSRDGSPVYGYTTVEATSVHGTYGRQQAQTFGRQAVKRQRLMPESIIPLTDDPEQRRVMLRNAGYLDYATAVELKDPAFIKAAQARGMSARDYLVRRDQQAADQVYKAHGIRLN